MKIFVLVAFLFVSASCFAQGIKDAVYAVKSTKPVKDFNGVYMVINLKVEDRPTNDHTVVYSLADHEGQHFLISWSDTTGRIDLNLRHLKYIRYINIGGPEEITTRIDLIPFKGKEVVLGMIVKPNLRPYVD